MSDTDNVEEVETGDKPIGLNRLATILRRSIFNAYAATLIGNPPQITRNFFDRCKNPQEGDLVAEITTVYRKREPNNSDLNGVGVLEEIAWEKVTFEGDPDFIWDEEVEGRPHPKEKVFYIRTLDGRRFRWTNASFAAAVAEKIRCDL